jgi:hypothetical protein
MDGGMAMELSEEMREALRILREDEVIANTKASREANEALLKRLDERDAETKEWRGKLDERTKAAPVTPENDPQPTPGVPPAPTVVSEGEKEPKVKKRRGVWFQADEEEKAE